MLVIPVCNTVQKNMYYRQVQNKSVIFILPFSYDLSLIVKRISLAQLVDQLICTTGC